MLNTNSPSFQLVYQSSLVTLPRSNEHFAPKNLAWITPWRTQAFIPKQEPRLRKFSEETGIVIVAECLRVVRYS